MERNVCRDGPHRRRRGLSGAGPLFLLRGVWGPALFSAVLDICHQIEHYFNFPKPNELVQRAEIPGGMYTNMVAQLKQLKSEAILEQAMELIPRVRLDAGLPPLVTPTSQIVGAQALLLRLGLPCSI